MRALVQRVSHARVGVDDRTVGSISRGLLVYVGVAADDTAEDADAIADKVRYLRVFPDEHGKINRDVAQIGGAVLVVSNFSLMADCRQGRRPGFDAAAPPELAEPLYERVVTRLRDHLPVEAGQFRALMRVEAVNDGPLNLLLDSRRTI
ncbi:MAG: D-aminoacyl-tRNA deacylase [Phycisphaerae bacterium]|nr:D-aminoacyl-tRNA deacylase [Phycisphaerae bacterium]